MEMMLRVRPPGLVGAGSFIRLHGSRRLGRAASSGISPSRRPAIAFGKQQQWALHGLVPSRAILSSLPEAGRSMSSRGDVTSGSGMQSSFFRRLLGNSENGEASPSQSLREVGEGDVVWCLHVLVSTPSNPSCDAECMVTQPPPAELLAALVGGHAPLCCTSIS